MAGVIKLSDGGETWYLVWSSICDAPLTYGMTLAQLREFYRDEHGAEGIRRLERDMPRIEALGHSSLQHNTVDEILAGNRAGPGETEISKAEIIQQYCRTHTGGR